MVTLSAATFVRRLQGRSKAIAFVGSVLVHVGLATYLICPVENASLETAEAQKGFDSGAVKVRLVSNASTAGSFGYAEEFHPAELAATARAAAAPDLLGTEPFQALRRRPAGGMTAIPMMPSSAPPALVMDGPARTVAVTNSNPSSDRAPSVPANAALGSDYAREILAHIEPFKRYPEDANRNGVRGVVQLVFELDREGRVLGVWVARSSGFASLDSAAVDTLRRADPLPAIPLGLPDALTVQLPVEFSGPNGA